MDGPPRPARSTIAWHWAVAVGVLFMLTLGFAVSSLPRGPMKTEWVQIHKSFGIIVFALALARIVWRWRVSFVAGGSGWERIAARTAHALLLAATVAAPISGVIRSIAYARPVSIFGVPFIPQLLAEKNEALNEAAGAVHDAVAWTLVALTALHVLASLKHHFVDRDEGLRRMALRRAEAPGAGPQP